MVPKKYNVCVVCTTLPFEIVLIRVLSQYEYVCNKRFMNIKLNGQC